MRQVVHAIVGIAFWLLLAALWVMLVLGHKATGAAFRGAGFQVAVLTGVVFAITMWWIRHNVGIYRRKGPRTERANQPPRTDEDRLGRRLRWAMPGGARTARAQQHLVIELDGDVKTYRRGR
jgi:hypothetical protein